MPIAKGGQIKINEDGVGGELSHALSKVAICANVLNRLLRAGVPHLEDIARKLTLGMLAVVGDKGLDLQKRITAQKAEYEARNKHSVDLEDKQGWKSFRCNETRKRHHASEHDPYEDYPHRPANIQREVSERFTATPTRGAGK